MVGVTEGTPSEDRGQWGSKAEFLLSCIGLSVGLGNVWRFPYLAVRNGGGAFLLPYLILLFLVGKPMYYMELALGQFSQSGPVKAFSRMAPVGKGIGFAMLIICSITVIYYNVLMAYSLFYICASFSSTLPWTECNDEWTAGTNITCYTRDANNTDLAQQRHCGVGEDPSVDNCTTTIWKTSASLYFNKTVLAEQELGEFGDIGPIHWKLALCLLASWILVFLCLMKGIKSSGKVVYVTATTPYLILCILLIVGVTRPGAGVGIAKFFTPDFGKLLDFTVWRQAAEQMFFSLSVSWGSIIMFGSYNKFNNNVKRDSLIVSSMDTVTSIIGGIVVFSILGSLAHQLNTDISNVTDGGPGLAFVIYPEALSYLPLPQFWAVLFFLMLFTLGLDSEFALLETILTALYDEFPKCRNYKAYITGALCTLFFLLGLPCVSSAGTHVFDIMDTFGGMGVAFVAICEVITIMWIYGFNKFSKDLETMMGFKTSMFWKICWAYLSPVLLIIILIASFATFKTPLMNGKLYPTWAYGIGWTLASLPFIAIVTAGVWAVSAHKKNAIHPTLSWGPDSEVFKATEKNHTREFASYVAHDNPVFISAL